MSAGIMGVFLMALPGVLAAQVTREFGAARFTAPPGWTLEARPAFQTLTRSRGAELCMVGITADEPMAATLDAAFAQAWKTVFSPGSYMSARQPAMQAQVSPAGYRHAVGEGEIVDARNNRLVARLHVFPTVDRAQTVVLIGNSRSALDGCRADWDVFFASLRFPSVATVVAAEPTVRAGAARNSGSRESRPSETPSSTRLARERASHVTGPMQFDNMSFTPPSGWNVEQGAGRVSLTPTDTRGSEELHVILLEGRLSTGDLRQEFEQTWSEVASSLGAQLMRSVNGGPFDLDEPGRSVRGWDYLHGSGGMRIGADVWTADLYVMKPGDRVERVVVLAKDFRDNVLMTSAMVNPRYARAIRQLVFTLQFANLPAVAVPAASLRGNGITGVWAGISMSLGALKPHFAIFFDNGRAFFGPNFPVRGLLEIDPSIEEHGARRYWGRYTMQGATGTIMMPYGAIPIRLNGSDLTLKTNNTDHRYGRLTLPEARWVEGTWCLGGGQCLRLGSGGRFEDEGAARVLEHSTYAFAESPDRGVGEYEVRDYTLVLRYDGGPEVRIAFLGLAGSSAAPQMLLSSNVDVLTRR